jgi:ABC-2 type transport system ATP-binding protein
VTTRRGSPYAFLLPATAIVAAVWLLGIPRLRSDVVPTPLAVVVGVSGGVALFRVLAGRWPQPSRLRRHRARRTIVASAYLATRSTVEEVAWRGFVLGALARAVSPVPALVLSTLGFAASHAATGRKRFIHLATGGLFGGVYLMTGRLVAPIGAHVAYNLLIGLTIETGRSANARATAEMQAHGRPATRCRARTTVASSEVVAELDEVRKDYGTTRALDGLSMTLRAGEVVALLGPNGAGKTTAVSILLGIKRPSAGRATLFGDDPRSTSPRRHIGVTPQDVAFPAGLRVAEVVDLVRAHFEAPEPRETLLRRFELADLARRQAGGLSGGEKRRLALALAFAGRPKAVFLDEPTAGLDVEARRSLWTVLQAHAGAGGTILLTTHRLDEAEALATRIVVLDHGRVLASGSIESIKEAAGVACVRLRTSELPELRNVERSERAGEVVTLYTRNAPALVAELVSHGVELTGLEVRPLSLEEAFLSLTSRAAS